MLEKVSVSEPGQNLSHSLRELEHAELLQRRRIGADADWEYRFRHPLIHDVVYQSLLLETRSILHEKAGAAIEELYSDKLDNYTDLLAYHYGRSANVEKALHYLTLAGDKAAKLVSYWEALDYYGSAMEKAESLADDLRKKQLVVDLVMKRSSARHMLGCLKPDVEELEKYLKWVEELGDQEKVADFYNSLTYNSCCMGDWVRFERYVDRNAFLLETLYDRYRHRPAEGYRGLCYFHSDDYEAAVVLIQSLVEYDDKDDLPCSLSHFSFRLSRLSKVYSLMGQWNEALASCQTSLNLGTENSLGTAIIEAHSSFGGVYLAMGEWEKTIVECETALKMSPSGLVIIGIKAKNC